MQKLVWKNSLGDEIDLTSGNYGITQWEGFSNASLNIQSQQVPFQDGGVYLDSLINQRELSVTLKMQDNGNLEERYRMRRELIHILNPKLGEGYLIYTNDFISKRIKCVAQIPLFETHNSDTRGTPKASLAWTACEPYWEDLEETVVNIEKGQRVEIINEGDIKTNAKIEVVFSDTLQNKAIRICNFTTDQKIEVLNEQNSPIKINTNTGEKTVTRKSYAIKPFVVNVSSILFEDENINLINKNMIFKYKDLLNYETIYYKNQNEIDKVVKFNGQYYGIVSGLAVYKSQDLQEWTLVVSTSGTRLKIANGKLYILGTQYSKVSTDGINFTDITTSHTIADVVFLNNLYVFVGANGKIWTSTNGSSLTSRTSGTETYLYKVVNFKGYFVAIGSTELIRSSNGTSWESVSISGVTFGYYCQVANTQDLLLLTTTTGTVTTEDCTNWEINPIENMPQLAGLKYLQDYNAFVGANTFGQIISIPRKDYYVNWSKIKIEGEYSSHYNFYNSDCADNKIFSIAQWFNKYNLLVIDTQKTIIKETREHIEKYCYNTNTKKILIAYSKNGVTAIKQSTFEGEWETEQLLSFYANSIIYSQRLNLYIAGGNNGNLATSVDGVSWQTVSGVTGNIQVIAENKKAIYIMTDSAIIKTENMADFENIYSRTATENIYKSASFENDRMLFCNYADKKVIYSVDNGENFVEKTLDIDTNLQGGIINGGYFVFITFDGKILYTLDCNSLYLYARPIISYFGESGITTKNGELIFGGSDFVGELGSDKDENIIDNLTSDSNMNLYFEEGNNNILVDAEGMIAITFRQKYIGV